MNNIRYILIALLIIVVVNISGCMKQPDIQDNQISNSTSNMSIDNNYTSDYSIPIISTTDSVCKGCHMSGKSSVPQIMSVRPHINGGYYCMTCHNISHETHPIDDNVTCNKCHEGDSPAKPIFTNGSIVCNNCHDFPDPLKPSYGNIIKIHDDRNVTCITCHAEKCTKCHIDIGTSDRWTNRLNHFKVILNTLRYDNNT